jgi:hypothetical protein
VEAGGVVLLDVVVGVARRQPDAGHRAGDVHGEEDAFAVFVVAQVDVQGQRVWLGVVETVECHLYRAYPKLGVTSRHDLRKVLAVRP